MVSLKLPEEIQQSVIRYYENYQRQKYIHSEQVYRFLNKTIIHWVKLFQVETQLTDSGLVQEANSDMLYQLSSMIEIKFFPKDEVVVKQNDMPDYFYLVLDGLLEVSQEKGDFMFFDRDESKNFIDQQIKKYVKRKKEIEAQQNKSAIKKRPRRIISLNQEQTFEIINEVTEGKYFGEVAIMTGLLRTATIYTISDCYLGAIKEGRFREFVDSCEPLKSNIMCKIEAYKDEMFRELTVLVSNVPAFRNLPLESIRKIVNRLRKTKYLSGQFILRAGEIMEQVFLVSKGEVTVNVRNLGGEDSKAFIILKKGACFNFAGCVFKRPAIFDFICGAPPNNSTDAHLSNQLVLDSAQIFLLNQSDLLALT